MDKPIFGSRISLKFNEYPREFFLLVISTLAIFLAYNITLPILPLHLLLLGAGSLEIGAIMGTLSFVLTFTKLPSGILAQRSTMQRALAFSATGQAITQILYSVCTASNCFIFAQIFHAITLAPLVSVGIASSQKMAPDGRRGEAMGFYLCAYGIAATVGPVICSLLLLWMNYAQIFLISSAIPLLGVLPFLFVKGSVHLGIDETGSERNVIKELGLLVRSRNVNLVSFLRFLYATTFGFFGAFFVIHAEVNLLFLPSAITLMLAAMGAADLIARFPLGRMLDRIDYRWALVGSYAILGFLYYVLSEIQAPFELTAILFLTGLATGVRVTSEWVMLADNSPEGARSMTSGYMSTIDNIGRGFGATLGGYIVMASSISLGFKLAGAIMFVAALVSTQVGGSVDPAVRE